jgi:hypothetical protein
MFAPREARDVVRPLRELRGPYGSDLWIWWTYTLELKCNRHVAEYHSNETVSSALRKMRERMPTDYFE